MGLILSKRRSVLRRWLMTPHRIDHHPRFGITAPVAAQ
jgi:hypothetical protein